MLSLVLKLELGFDKEEEREKAIEVWVPGRHLVQRVHYSHIVALEHDHLMGPFVTPESSSRYNRHEFLLSNVPFQPFGWPRDL